MGKQAAAAYSRSGKSLSDAVVEVAKHASLSPEQIRRVCEFANTAAYLEAFEKSGEMRNVTFEHGPADPSFVVKELNDGSVPALHHQRNHDYDRRPGNYKTAGADTALAEAFLAPGGLMKTAEVARDPEARRNPVDELYDIRCHLADTRDQYMSKLSSCDVMLDEVRDRFCEAVRQEVMQGTELQDIGDALSQYNQSSMLKQAMSTVAEFLKSRGMDKHASVDLARFASSRVSNTAHPVVERFIELTKVATQREFLKNVVEVLNEQLAQVDPALRSVLNGL
jgi:hypothetical protein